MNYYWCWDFTVRTVNKRKKDRRPSSFVIFFFSRFLRAYPKIDSTFLPLSKLFSLRFDTYVRIISFCLSRSLRALLVELKIRRRRQRAMRWNLKCLLLQYPRDKEPFLFENSMHVYSHIRSLLYIIVHK